MSGMLKKPLRIAEEAGITCQLHIVIVWMYVRKAGFERNDLK
jgi:hypothetical protein